MPEDYICELMFRGTCQLLMDEKWRINAKSGETRVSKLIIINNDQVSILKSRTLKGSIRLATQVGTEGYGQRPSRPPQPPWRTPPPANPKHIGGEKL